MKLSALQMFTITLSEHYMFIFQQHSECLFIYMLLHLFIPGIIVHRVSSNPTTLFVYKS